jgi:hypothetical protein
MLKNTADILSQHGASAQSGRFIKRLFGKEHTQPLTAILSAAYGYHRAHTLPWDDDGSRVLTTAAFEEYMAKMRTFGDQLSVEGRLFGDKYDAIIEEERQKQNGMFRLGDYPSKDAILSRLNIRLEPSPVPDGGDFRVIVSKEEMSQWSDAIADRVAQAEKAGRIELYKRLAEPLSNIITRLSDPDAIFRDSLLGNLQEIVAIIPKLNVTGDAGLEEIRARAEAELCSFSPGAIRTSPTTRRAATDKANQLLKNLNGYLNL